MSMLYWPVYVLVLALSFVVGVVPRSLGIKVATALGALAYYVLPKRRRVMANNYAPVLGKAPSDPEVQRVGKQSMRNFARYLYEILRFPHCSVEEIDSRVTLHVRDDVEAALAQGKGMILVSAHFGNMDYTGTAVARRIVPMTVVADPLKPQRLMDKLVEFRSSKGLCVVYLAKAARATLQALRRNEGVGFLVDVGYNRTGGIPVTFFGRRTMVPAGPALLSLRTGAPIVVGCGVVNGDRFEGLSYPPIYATPTGNKAEDARRCSQLIAAHFEDFIRRYPEQWYIYRPMWGPDAQAEMAEGEGMAAEPVNEAA